MRQPATVNILDYQDRWADDFKRLNIEWLEKYFHVESVDQQVLSDPRRFILQPGGEIFFARVNDCMVGTVALIPGPAGSIELSKMAVTPGFQGLKIGRQLLERAITAFEKRPEELLFLESNHTLKPALTLYRSCGFVRTPKPEASHYQRADVYMEYRPE